MEIKILSPLWGHEHLAYQAFLEKVRQAGYDGFDLWLPDSKADQGMLLDFLQRHEMIWVAHQHAAYGSSFNRFKRSFAEQLKRCAAAKPLLINSHSGKDYFSLEQQLTLIDVAAEISTGSGVPILHETHRARLGYAPQNMELLFHERQDFLITADFSHWTCVTESMLENFDVLLTEAIARTRHVHARVGYQQGPQIPDPRAPQWHDAVSTFLSWWDRVVAANKERGAEFLTFTTEFGPIPYMPVLPFSGNPVANQFEVNCFMKDLLIERYR